MKKKDKLITGVDNDSYNVFKIICENKGVKIGDEFNDMLREYNKKNSKHIPKLINDK